MSKIWIYSKTTCPYCDMAKKLLTEKGYSYTEISMDDPDVFTKFKAENPGVKTVPQIFVEKEFGSYKVGGYTDLKDLMEKNLFDIIFND